ncbi:MAG: hypothetical protein N3C63_11515 [Rhodocyclaceae bacterium]|nr:hypothetical protein [Rhodocyclaceae bacterium]
MPRRRYPFHLLATALFSLVVLSIGGSIGGLAWWQQRALLLEKSAALFARSLRESETALAAAWRPIQAQLTLLVTAPPPERQRLAALAKLLDEHPEIRALRFRQRDAFDWTLTPLPHAEARRQARAPASAAYRLDRSSELENRSPAYFDRALGLLAAPSLDAPQRAESARTGLVLSAENQAGRVRIEAHIDASQLSALLSSQRATPSMQIALQDSAGRLLASSHGAWPVDAVVPAPSLASLDLPLLAALANEPQREKLVTLMDTSQRPWLAIAHHSEIVPGLPVLVLMAAPKDEVTAEADRLLLRMLLFTLAGLALSAPLIWLIARQITHSLRRLAASAAEVKAFRFDELPTPATPIAEVEAIADAMAQMRSTIRRFLDISARLAAERHYGQLLEEIVAETMAAAEAGAGVLYLFEHDGRLVPVTWKRSGGMAPQAPERLNPAQTPLLVAVFEKERPTQMQFAPVYLPLGLEWLGCWFPGQALEALFVPLRNRAGDRLGLLLLARSLTAGPWDEPLVAFIGALSGTLAISLEKQKLLEGRQALLDGIVRMLAGAIDARSPHTGAHCQRVPLLAALLAEAATSHPESPFRDTPFDEHAREALHLAAWLHDCGKLFVPDYVGDKATKLDAVYNRIHEIRMRFEVLKRDAEIAYWQARAQGGEEAALREALEQAWRELDEDFAFVAACNLGERELDEADLARLVAIGNRTWLRTLDDRLGIAAEELRRKSATPARPLPAPEHLLADRLEHLIDLPGDPPPSEGPAAPLRLHRPRHRLNLGELYCLSVRRGTLTAEERYLINAHILGTISMLSTLPFPAELASVPETAGAHHEHLDGSGYPFGKTARELSLAARILAIADVFEALTAGDRPYKTGKSAAEALAVMHDMARRGHLDADLLKLFIDSDIPARYAELLSPRAEAV